MAHRLHQASPGELKARIEAEREGHRYLILRDNAGKQQIVPLDPACAPITLGRSRGCTVRLDWDREVSGLHAELKWRAGDWVLVDDGLSRNGSFVNRERIAGRRRLRDGDELTLGATRLVFKQPSVRARTATTNTSAGLAAVAAISDAQRRVLIALCRPFRERRAFAKPATNRQIAEELFLTVAAVKTHLRALFSRFGIDELPQNEKRLRLVEIALQTGLVTDRDLTAE